MSTLHLTTPSFPLTKKPHLPPLHRVRPLLSGHHRRPHPLIIQAHKVTIEHQGQITELEVEADETILSKALDVGMSLPYDCNLGVCMTCPALLISGTVDQSEGMLSDDVLQRGFALLCAAYPRSDCRIKTIPEEQLLAMQLATAND